MLAKQIVMHPQNKTEKYSALDIRHRWYVNMQFWMTTSLVKRSGSRTTLQTCLDVPMDNRLSTFMRWNDIQVLNVQSNADENHPE